MTGAKTYSNATTEDGTFALLELLFAAAAPFFPEEAAPRPPRDFFSPPTVAKESQLFLRSWYSSTQLGGCSSSWRSQVLNVKLWRPGDDLSFSLPPGACKRRLRLSLLFRLQKNTSQRDLTLIETAIDATGNAKDAN